jgi:hypothetical protein
MSAPANCKLIGRWRIVQADIWERDHLDLYGPAVMTITDHGRGEIAFGALQAGLDIEYSRSAVGFTWEGFDEMDEVSGDGSLDDGSIEIEFAYPNGDEAVLKAKWENSSTACWATLRAKSQSTPLAVSTPETCWPSLCSRAGRHGTSWKPMPSSIIANRPH